MTTGKALNGKPYAGNPHVAPSQCYGGTGRFDEGEVASAATPRRGSLLYKHSKLAIIAGLVAGLFTGFGYAAEVSSDDALCAVKGWVSLKESLD